MSSDEGNSDQALAAGDKPNLTAGVVLSLLEADQVVAAKKRSRFGRRDLSFGIKVLLWSLRVYVVVMLVLVVVSVFRAIHGLN